MALLNFPMNVIPGAFTQALAKAEQAQKLAAHKDIGSLSEAVKLLGESNQLLINALTDNQIK